MRRLLYTMCVILLFSGMASAQSAQPPSYVINLINRAISEDNALVVAEFGVTNTGGDAAQEATVELAAIDVDGTRVVANTAIRALEGNSDREIMSLTAPVTLFPPGNIQQFRLQLRGADIAHQAQTFSIQIPVYAAEAYNPAAAPETGAEPTSPNTFTIPFAEVTVDLNRPDHIALMVGIAGAGLVVLWLLSVLARLIFRRPAPFGTWQPPYATLPPLDPNTTYGRRQLWQQHAQNNAIMAPCVPGGLHATKTLMGMDGRHLSGWRILSVRMSQYDMYGRVARTQILAAPGIIRRLNRAAGKSGQLERARLQRRLRPVGKRLARQIAGKINSRTAMLPVALDVRFRGLHGEVMIVFQVFQCHHGYWQLIDSWQPEMMIASKTIYDTYTYSIFGQSGGESLREFRRRLPDELTHLLTELVGARPFVPETIPQRDAAAPTPRGTSAAETKGR